MPLDSGSSTSIFSPMGAGSQPTTTASKMTSTVQPWCQSCLAGLADWIPNSKNALLADEHVKASWEPLAGGLGVEIVPSLTPYCTQCGLLSTELLIQVASSSSEQQIWRFNTRKFTIVDLTIVKLAMLLASVLETNSAIVRLWSSRRDQRLSQKEWITADPWEPGVVACSSDAECLVCQLVRSRVNQDWLFVSTNACLINGSTRRWAPNVWQNSSHPMDCLSNTMGGVDCLMICFAGWIESDWARLHACCLFTIHPIMMHQSLTHGPRTSH